jgi:hypothetical protein
MYAAAAEMATQRADRESRLPVRTDGPLSGLAVHHYICTAEALPTFVDLSMATGLFYDGHEDENAVMTYLENRDDQQWKNFRRSGTARKPSYVGVCPMEK